MQSEEVEVVGVEVVDENQSSELREREREREKMKTNAHERENNKRITKIAWKEKVRREDKQRARKNE